MFSEFKTLVQKQWKTLCESPQLYSIRITNGELFDTYLRAFPEQHRQHHNCNCCKSFLNNYGNLVAIKNGKILTLWDFSASDIYEDVPVYLRRALKDKSIEGPFISKQRGLGTDYNFEMIEEASHRWDHFFVTVPSSMVYSGTRTIDTVIGDFKTTQQVFTRSLETITLEALREVMDLIEQNALYRGKEFEGSLKNFYSLRTKYAALKTPREKDIFTWEFAKDGGRIRNTAIGTLVVDISEGKDIELAVKSFETIMAPANYRRPTTLVTPKMVQAAKDKIQELGFGDSLRRRHCFDTDVKVNNLLFVNRGVSHGDVFDSISSETPVNANVEARKVDAVIVCKLDRLTRSVKDLAALLEVFCKRSVSLVSVAESLDTGTAAGRLMLHLLMSVSQWEREAIGERTRFAMQFKKKNQERVGNIQYGFRLGEDGKHVESDPVEQNVIARIRELRAKGKTLRAIANELNKSDIKTRRGTSWHHVYVNGVLKASGSFSS